MTTLSPLSQRLATDPAFAKFATDSRSLYNQLVDISRQLQGMSSTPSGGGAPAKTYAAGTDIPESPAYGPLKRDTDYNSPTYGQMISAGGDASGNSTIANSPVRRYTSGVESPYAKAARTYYEGLNREKPDEGAIRRRQREGVQELLDSINTYYAGEIAKKQEEGKGITGAARAAAARSGTLGQDFGLSEVDKAQGLANERVKAVEAQRNAQVAAILADVENRAQDKIEAEKKRADTNAQEYLKYLEGNQTEARTSALNLAKLGKSVKDLPTDQYNQLLEQTGYTPEELDALFTINKPENKVLASFTQGNKYYVVTQDPITKERKTESVDLGFTVPTDWQHQNVGNSIIFFDPKNPQKNNYIYTVAPSEKDSAQAALDRANAAKITAELAGGDPNAYEFSNDDRGKLINVDFSQDDINSIEKDVRTYGAAKVLEGITDTKQKNAITEVLQGKAATVKVTREQVRQAIDFGDKAVSPEDVAAQMKNKYTNDELEQMTLDAGYAWIRPVTDSDIADYLASPEAREKYADLLYEQYKAAGLAE